MIDYGHGDDIFKYKKTLFKANFSSNVWYKGSSKKLIKHLKKQLKNIENYPEPSGEELCSTIEQHHNLRQNNSIVTNGATEAFYLIANAFNSSSVTLCTPSFSEYEQASIANSLNIDFINRKDILRHHFKTKLAFICNPNNPDGFENTQKEIALLTKRFPNTIFIIDEAYTEFTCNDISCVPLLRKRNNIILVKSLTKLFCIPGLRLGYILTNSTLIKQIVKVKMPWNINSIALQAGVFLFNNYKQLTPDFTKCFENSEKLKEEINELPNFEVTPTNTSYFLVKISKPQAKILKSYLIGKHQLLIRNASNFRTLNEHYIRISSQTPKRNKLLIKALKEWNKQSS